MESAFSRRGWRRRTVASSTPGPASGALAAEDLLPPALAHVSRSWRRSLDAGLNAFRARPPAPLTRLEVARATERQHELLAHARPIMEYLMGQTREHAGMVILATGAVF